MSGEELTDLQKFVIKNSKLKNNFAGSPIESKIVELKKAKYIQEKEFITYLKMRQEKAEVVLQNEQKVFSSIPPSVISLQAKKDFMSARKTVMIRAYKTEAENKRLSEWTIPKMKIKAKELERQQIQDEIERENTRKYKAALTA